MDNNWHSQINKSERQFIEKSFHKKQICKRKQSTKTNLGPIGTIVPLSLHVQRTHITMDFLKKTKEILKQSGKQLRNN